MGLIQTAAPATEPITLSEAKAHLRVTGSDEDALITSLIAAARDHVELVTRRALVTQTWKLTLDEFPETDFIRLPRAPLQSVSSVTYVDDAGATQTWSSANYVADLSSLPGKVDLAYNVVWPSSRAQANAVAVTFICGYGAAAAVPEAIKAAIKLLIGGWFENRESVTDLSLSAVPMAVDALLGPYRVLEAV